MLDELHHVVDLLYTYPQVIIILLYEKHNVCKVCGVLLY